MSTEQQNTWSNKMPKFNPLTPERKQFLLRNAPVFLALLIGIGGSFGFGYMLGHRQGLTVVGIDGDSKQLNEVVKQQKADLEIMSKQFNATVQERDVAVSNANKFYQAFVDEQARSSQLSTITSAYGELLRTRGGVELMVQSLNVKPLPDNAFEYIVDLVQVSPTKIPATGQIELRLIRGSEVMAVPMQNNVFRFDEYQRLTGRWTMPKGFEPSFVEVRLTGIPPKRFTWQRGKQTVTPESQIISEIPQTKPSVK